MSEKIDRVVSGGGPDEVVSDRRFCSGRMDDFTTAVAGAAA
jgi:hypothetical protein